MMNINLEHAYKPIGLEEKFDSKKFVEEYTKTSRLEQTLESLKKDSNDINAIKNAGILTFQNPNFYTSMENPGMTARYASEKSFEEGDAALMNYSVKNSNDLYSALGIDEKSHLLLSSEVLKEKEQEENKNEEYNHFADLANLSKGLKEISEKDTEEAKQGRVGFIAEQSQYSPKWMQEMNQSFGANQKYIDALFQEYMMQINNDYTKIILNEEGKPDKDKLGKFSDINFKLHNEAEEKDFEFFKTLKDVSYSALVKAEMEKEKSKQE